jgi:hypothetical protein
LREKIGLRSEHFDQMTMQFDNLGTTSSGLTREAREMKRIILSITLLASCLAVSMPAWAVTSLTIKDASCASWLDARARNEHYQTAWLLGYLTGVSVGANVNILKGTEPEFIESWMDDYCKSNPQKKMTDGTSDLIDVLLKTGK